MTTETTEAKASGPSVGATTDMPLTWHQINWRQAERNVRRLQARIAQATQAGKWGKVKALQHLLTHSYQPAFTGTSLTWVVSHRSLLEHCHSERRLVSLSGKALAVRRVTENTGK